MKRKGLTKWGSSGMGLSRLKKQDADAWRRRQIKAARRELQEAWEQSGLAGLIQLLSELAREQIIARRRKLCAYLNMDR